MYGIAPYEQQESDHPRAGCSTRSGIDFTRLAVAEAELQVKDLLVEVLNKLAEVEANQDEIDEWRGRAERLLTDQRRPW